MEPMKYPFDLTDFYHPDFNNLTDIDLQALLEDICSNASSRRRVPRYAWQRILLDIHVVGLLCLVGFVGNALTIAVLRRDLQDGSSATNWLLRTLAGVDTFYLVACLFIQTFKTSHDLTDWFPATLRPFFPYAERYLWPVAAISQTVTIWTVLLVTVDRYMAVCRPFDTHMRSVERSKKLFVAVMLAAIVYNIPQFFERQVVVKTNDCIKQVELSVQGHAMVTKTSLRDNKLYFVVYKMGCYLVFRTVGPLVTLLVLNQFLIRALHATRRRHQKISATTSTRRSKHRENVTLILVVVVSVFIVCQLPDVGLRVAAAIAARVPKAHTPGSERFMTANNIYDDKDFMRYVNSITNVLLTLNSAVNFLIYCLVGKKFRRIFMDMFCKCMPCYRHHRRPSSVDQSDIKLVPTRRTSNVSTRAITGERCEPSPQALSRRRSLILLEVPGGNQEAMSRSAPSLLLPTSSQSQPSTPCRIDVHVCD